MKKIIASIDIGTNTVSLLIAEISQSKISQLFHSEHITALGEGLSSNNYIKTESINRSIKHLFEFKKIIKKYNVQKELCVATSALRQAKNKISVINKIKSIGFFPLIISGKEEAQYIGNIIKYEFPNIINNTLIIDIGGGSTELIYFYKSKIKLIQSIEIGSVTLFEKFFSDPINKTNINECVKHINYKLNNSILSGLKCSNIIGVGGTITSLSALFNNVFPYNPKKVHKSILPINSINYLSNQLLNNTIEERTNISLFEYRRARVIPAGLLIFSQIMTLNGLKKLLVCEKGLRWGVLLEDLFN